MGTGDGTGQLTNPEYHNVNHTAVQPCGWTKNALNNEGTCYKSKFYGIQSHRCIQMTPVVRCNERCVFCWREHSGHAYELDGVEWDDPEAVVDASIELQKKLLSGFGGNDAVDEATFEEAMDPRHVAISLDGEPTLYPYLPELIQEYHKRGITTFLVSNGTRPEMIKRCDPTQLYLSLDAPTREIYNDVVKPMDDNAWDALLESLDIMGRTDSRTTIRTTLVGEHNDKNFDEYAELYQRADPDFVELKAYMHVGHSRDRLDRSTMPDHDDVIEFAQEMQKRLPEYSVLKDSPPSRVVMISKEKNTHYSFEEE